MRALFIDHNCFEIDVFCSVCELYCCGRETLQNPKNDTKRTELHHRPTTTNMSNLMTSWLLKETAAYAKRSIEEGLDEDDNQRLKGGPVQIVKVSLESHDKERERIMETKMRQHLFKPPVYLVSISIDPG